MSAVVRPIARLLAELRAVSSERDNPWGVPGRITTVCMAVFLALITLADPLIALMGILADGVLRVSVLDPRSPGTPVPSGYEGVLEDASAERNITYGYFTGAPGWALALEAVLIAAFIGLVVAAVVLLGMTIAPTSAYWRGGDPWARIELMSRRLRRCAFGAVMVQAAFAWLIPWMLSPKSGRVGSMTIGGAGVQGPWAVLLGIWVLSYFVSALSRLHARTGELAAENAELRSQTEGLV